MVEVVFRNESDPFYRNWSLEMSMSVAVGDTLNFEDCKADVVAYQFGVYILRQWPWHKYLWNPVLQTIVRTQCWLLPGKFRWWLR